jgi:hypothetical protein
MSTNFNDVTALMLLNSENDFPNGKASQQTRDLLTPTELDLIKLSQRTSTENIVENDIDNYSDCLETVGSVSFILADAMKRAKNYRIAKNPKGK